MYSRYNRIYWNNHYPNVLMDILSNWKTSFYLFDIKTIFSTYLSHIDHHENQVYIDICRTLNHNHLTSQLNNYMFEYNKIRM